MAQNQLPIKFYQIAEPESPFAQIIASATGAPIGATGGQKEITLQEAQRLSQQYPNILISGQAPASTPEQLRTGQRPALSLFDRDALLAGRIPQSEILAEGSQPGTSFVPVKQEEEFQKQQADLAAGKIKNIGTAEAPRYVPTETPNPQIVQPVLQSQTSANIQGGQQQQTYTVQAGDTLSAIAQKYGVSINDITGYRSGNPNLIYPGEVLSVRTGKVSSQPKTPIVEQPGASGSVPKEQQALVETDLFDKQNQLTALQKFGLTDTNQLTKDDSGNYVPDTNNPATLLDKFGLGTGTQLKLEDVIKQVATAFGMTDINNEMKTLDDKFANEVQETQDNPWISQSELSRRLKSLADKYDTKKSQLIERLKLKGDMVSTAISLYEKEKQNQQELFLQAIKIRESQLNRSLQERKLLEVSAGATLYDPITGRAIFTAPKIDGESELVSPDLADAIIQNPTLFNMITPTARQKIVPILKAKGFDVDKLLTTKQLGEIAEAGASASSALNIIGQIKSLTSNLFAQTPVGAFKQRATIPLKSFFRTDEQVALFDSTIQTFLSMLTRALGEKGVLTNIDVGRVRRGLPIAGDTQSIANKKIVQMEQLVKNIRDGKVEAYMQPLRDLGIQFTPSTDNSGVVQPSSKDSDYIKSLNLRK